MAVVHAFILVSLTTFSLHFFQNSFVEAGRGGFSVDLIHRDSPQSPFYNPSDTLSDRVSKAIRRSSSRVDYFRSLLKSSTSINTTSIQSEVLPNGGEYLMSLSIGTPPVKLLAIADTGSDLIWTQCKPCEQCYHQTTPLFDPSKSSTYRDLSCESNTCAALPQASCSDSRKCEYSYSYGDKSYTNGLLAVETLTFASSSRARSSIKIPKISFGCGHNNDGTFNSHGAGLVGLGGGQLSLISQLGSSINGKFSYCLVPLQKTTSSSQMIFGDSATVSISGVVSTPLIPKEPDTFYYLNLEAISIGTKKVEFPSVDEGNIIIDSGTTLTYLETSIFNKLESALKGVITLPPAEDPTRTLDVCYQLGSDAELPNMKFSFTGADLVLPPLNTFIQVSDDVVCLAIVASDSFSIFGNIAQQNIEVGYDLVGKTVSFAKTDCTKH
ncbi:aspartic proteinase CDR1-like [Magnolia sinica]|uniref:aspartic proteinase CDR1-like n=1 Tax=Magnolia sinica TaxID=86752 RepID=UPI00265A4323|nr:aspartic proteinase CDR1-like [Magnolia sinica]